MNQVQVKGLDRSALQNRGHAADHDELHLLFRENPEDFPEIRGAGWHGGFPESRWCSAAKYPTAGQVSARASSGSKSGQRHLRCKRAGCWPLQKIACGVVV